MDGTSLELGGWERKVGGDGKAAPTKKRGGGVSSVLEKFIWFF